MRESVKRENLITCGGLLLYICSIYLKSKYNLPSDIEFGCFFASYLLAGYTVFGNVADCFVQKIFLDGNLLIVIATIGALGAGYYAEAVTVMLIFQIGNTVDKITAARSRKKIRELVDVHTIFANKILDGEEIRVESAELKKGDIIIIRPGERVPADGIIRSGMTSLDTQMITGEAIPRDEEPGSKIYSGSVNLTGAIEVEVLHAYGDSTVSKILNIIDHIDDKKADSERRIAKKIRLYVLGVFVIAAAIIIVPGCFNSKYEYKDGIERCLLFMVAACPCTISMSVPIAFLGGILSAAKKGIIVKGGVYLEILSKVNTFIFDKTGTLTEGVFEVQEIHAVGMEQEELLEIAAYIESYSNHPIAVSLKAAYGKDMDQNRITQMEEIPGYGLTAIYNGKRVYLGNARLMREKKIAFQELHHSGSVIYIAVEGRYAGHIVISDTLKKDVKDMLRYLKKKCAAVLVMVTGDAQLTGEEVAKKLNLDYYYANQLPEDKVKRLEEFMSMKDDTECLAAVGDGINDAPVLASADVGIAMGAFGSDAAIEAADIVLMDDEPLAVVDAIRIAKETMRVIRQNIAYAVFVKGMVLLLGITGMITMRNVIIIEVCVILLSMINTVWASKDPA